MLTIILLVLLLAAILGGIALHPVWVLAVILLVALVVSSRRA